MQAGTQVRTLIAAAGLLALGGPSLAAPAKVPVPTVRDERLAISLFAAEPDIVTPVGLAVDGKGRLYAVESHTHSPRADYAGPKHDRIKVLEDRDGDGRADHVRVFADGFVDAMNLAFAPDGSLYVVYQAGVDRLVDSDGDGRADDRKTVLKLETRQKYDHSGLLGLTFGPDGFLYVSRGNLGGEAYAFVGTDGRRLPGYGDGGNIVRCRPDGTALELVATGFWNPFDLRFDGKGRLLTVDNDPDARGPNRLVHVVPGGDYGYRARHGQTGLHPMSGWAGELPGTLGYAAGVGESPAGVLDTDTTALPASYRGELLATIWAENTIERLRPQPAGVSFTAKREVLVKGDREFRPVGIVAAPDGTIYISDWVKKDYPNHGLGRIWRLTAKPGVARMTPRPAAPQPDPGSTRIATLAAMARSADYPALRTALEDADPVVRAVAVFSLSRPVFATRVRRDLRHPSALVRLGALLALRRAGGIAAPLSPAPPGALRALLGDRDEQVRIAALIWAVDTMDLGLRPHLGRAIARPPVSPQLLQVYLAARQLLTPAEVAHLRARTIRSTGPDRIAPDVVEPVLRDKTLSPEVLAIALPFLGPPSTPSRLALIGSFLDASQLPLRLEAARSLAGTEDAGALEKLVALARDRSAPAVLRGEALAALAHHPRSLEACAGLLEDSDTSVQKAAARVLRVAVQSEAVRAAFTRRLQQARRQTDGRDRAQDRAMQAALAFALDQGQALEAPDRPATPDAWQSTLATGGDPAAGRLVFAHPMVACVRCHSAEGRGGHIGPDLSHIASSVDRARLVDSILNPSGEVSPEFQAYTVTKKDGEVLTGSQFHFRSGGAKASLRLMDGSEITLDFADVASYEAMDTSFMPQGLEATMTVDELRDLVAYLSTLK